MPVQPIDRWLEALKFENYRLGFMPKLSDAKVLQTEIRELESQPVAEIAGNDDFDARYFSLIVMKQDLASIQQMGELAIRLLNLREQMREKGFLVSSLDEADEIFDGFHAWVEKSKLEQRKRQWQHLRFVRLFWPKADMARRRRIAEMLAVYGRRRFRWGTLHLAIGPPARVGRWASRMLKL